ncbi:cold-shock protein [Paenibacillus sp. 1001270B_150601_E10]|uniref:cold-shock protein n=1 Tax=Paenibacillus sp. 1001270B_150601_E10 TaxID=2787079 RepID=UPI00189E22BA|nr:cold-shock protein [Paenibacillus sp. 1001270B_150601_E10]
MYHSRKRPMDEIAEEMTAIWSCTSDSCNGWMRDNFSFDNNPTCPHCQSPMVKGEKMLPVLPNTGIASQKEE